LGRSLARATVLTGVQGIVALITSVLDIARAVGALQL
jgi:hypothetical protein